MSKQAIIKIDGREYEFPLVESTEGNDAIDIGQLRAKTGLTTLDNGYGNTSACKSAVTYLDGENSVLRYRGYDIADLMEKSRFIEVCYLLIYGDLPTSVELENFEENVKRHTMINEEYKHYYDVWPNTAHPMAILASAMAGMSTFYQDTSDPFNPEHVHIATIRCLAKSPTLAAYAYKKSIGQPFVYPLNRLSYCGNFLNMMFSVPAEPYEIDPIIERTLNQLLMIHADHELNCSTATVRTVGSSQTNLYASVAAGMLALWGPLHGGANQKVIEMLNAIREEGGDVKKFVDKAKNPGESFRLMGFGHRVYKNFDPRCTLIKDTCHTVLGKVKTKNPLFDIALQLEEIALSDSYFIERKLYPNVDFYSGLLYQAMNFPINMFTVIFAIGRMPGWIAHWREMMQSKETKICRPRQVFIGEKPREFVPLEKRFRT